MDPKLNRNTVFAYKESLSGDVITVEDLLRQVYDPLSVSRSYTIYIVHYEFKPTEKGASYEEGSPIKPSSKSRRGKAKTEPLSDIKPDIKPDISKDFKDPRPSTPKLQGRERAIKKERTTPIITHTLGGQELQGMIKRPRPSTRDGNTAKEVLQSTEYEANNDGFKPLNSFDHESDSNEDDPASRKHDIKSTTSKPSLPATPSQTTDFTISTSVINSTDTHTYNTRQSKRPKA